MPKNTVTIEIEDSGMVVMTALGAFAAAVKKDHAAGGGIGEISADVMAAAKDLYPVIGQLKNMAADYKESPELFLKGLALGAFAVADALMTEAPAVPMAPAEPAAPETPAAPPVEAPAAPAEAPAAPTGT